MSIILKGIDLPKHDEGICVTIWKDGIVYARDIKTDTTIEAEAEAIQIPTPHGRLVDTSELIKSYMKGTKAGIDDFYDTIDIIDNTPTILEAEE